MKKTIYIIDDEPSMIQMAQALLENRGYVVKSNTSSIAGLKAVEALMPDLLLLDIQMDEMDGFEVCKRLKNNPKTRDIPIVIVSIQNAEADVVLGLELGAEDYIQKPFRSHELLARVKTALKRTESPQVSQIVRLGPLQLNHADYTTTIDGKTVDLALKEFLLLSYFIQREGHVLTRSAIAEAVWKTEHLPTSRTIDTHVDNIRKKIGVYRSWIKPLRGIGYRFESDD